MKEFDRLVEIMDILRSENGCPWDKKQSRESLKVPFLEEVYETLEAMDIGGEELCGELGDLALHIVFQAKIAKENNEFDIEDVLHEICEKLIRRHPHIFSDIKVETAEEVAVNWEKIKKQEKIHKNRKSVLDGVPKGLPSLLRADKIQKKVANYGFDWEYPSEVYNKVLEEQKEVEEAVLEKNKEHIEEEIGDLLFAITNYSRHLGINASEALRKSTNKFEERFRYIEKNCDIEEKNLELMEKLWNEAKNKEKKQ